MSQKIINAAIRIAANENTRDSLKAFSDEAEHANIDATMDATINSIVEYIRAVVERERIEALVDDMADAYAQQQTGVPMF